MEGEDAGERDVVLDAVAHHFEEVVDLGHGHESGQPEEEVEEKVREDVAVHQLENHERHAGGTGGLPLA